jgi:hypothetical protein
MSSAPPPIPSLAPPSGYAFEPELTGPTPRPLPELLKQGPHPASRRQSAAVLAAFGGFCVLLSTFPFVRTAGLYFLPLAWADWIGIGSLALALFGWANVALGLGRRRWVRDGIPLAVQIVELVKGPSAIVNGTPSQCRFTATVAFPHPQSGVPTLAQLQSDDFSWDARDAYDTPFRVGDHVTALYLAGKLEQTLRLYAFLGLRPEHALRRKQRGSETGSPLAVALLLVGLVVLSTSIIGGGVAYGRYEPIDFRYERAAIPIAAGALLIGSGFLAWIWQVHRRQLRRSDEHNQRAAGTGEALDVPVPFLGSGLHGWIVRILLALGAPLLGGGVVLAWLFLANAQLDESAPRPEPVRIESLVMKTHAFLFREYEIEYVFAHSGARAKLMSTPQHMMTLTSERGVALVREGAFGWPWVETIAPAELDGVR